ncbi:secreted protein [Colletotrichum kahawae]|uniref:Secreted protein n=1 Tax=Colletotrichum kahawae TaxID=34407 RepID=A0AAE0CWJ8_COLKA|nr:secreted protein [Colletotrichum kahawae]
MRAFRILKLVSCLLAAAIAPTLASNTTAPEGLTSTDTFTLDGMSWTVYEDLSEPGGDIILVPETGLTKRFATRLEATKTRINPAVPLFMDMDPADFNQAPDDLLADVLLKDGEPDEAAVRDVLPFPNIAGWDTFLGNVQANDTLTVRADARTWNYFPLDFHEKDILGDPESSAADPWAESIAFADVDSNEPIIVHVWYRTTFVINGQVETRIFAYDYPEDLPARPKPSSADFYGALLRFGTYWEEHLADVIDFVLPDSSWVDLTKHAFGMELVQRYSGGVYPKYGAYDRPYVGSEIDGFQDTFTNSLYANLLWGRFDQARAVLENYLRDFVSDTGDVDIRGGEIPQYGKSLSLLTLYVDYTGDTALLETYRDKILAWVNILTVRHDDSLALDPSDPFYGLIHGWSESDSVIVHPTYYNLPYFNNQAYAVRGLRDLSRLEMFSEYAADWTNRAEVMLNQTVTSLKSSTWQHTNPPYVPPLPNQNLTAIDSLAVEWPSMNRWAHRALAELLQAAVLPLELVNTVIDSMKANHFTSVGLLANVLVRKPESRDILGFIGSGYAMGLLLADRTDEFVLFLYAHRYYVHNRGNWIAGEVMYTNGAGGLYWQPAAFDRPVIMRAALVLEHPDDDVLYLARGLPHAWVATGDTISIHGAPTRWGRVDFSTFIDTAALTITAEVAFLGGSVPSEARVKLRVPAGENLGNVTVNGAPAMEVVGEEIVVWMGADVKNVTILGYF